MRNRIVHLLIVAFLLSPFAILAPEAEAAGKFKGTVQSVDVTAGTLTVKTRQNITLTLFTNEETRITRNGEQARLGDLLAGDRVDGRYNSETMLASRINARGEGQPGLERVEGTISAVDTSNRTLTIAPMREGRPVTLQVNDSTAITLDGQSAGLGDLNPGFSVGAQYNPEGMLAVRVQAESASEVRGVIREVNVPESTLTIATGDGDRSLTLSVLHGTPITLNDRPASLEDLRRGFQVVASYVPRTMIAVRIAATSLAELQGLIRAVDPDAGTVTIAPLVEGPAVQVHVTDSTVITLNGQRAELESLQPGMAARVVFHVGTFEAVSIAARSDGGSECTVVSVAGAILRVDVEGGHVVLDPLEGDGEVTLNVTNRTEITLNGQPARLSELRPGMYAAARFCRENHNATAIAARSEPSECAPTSVSGVIARVDVEGGHVAIIPANVAEPIALNVTERTEITLNGRPARLSDLRPGMRVEARFCRETMNAFVIAARSEAECTLVSVGGLIARVDPEGGHIAITPSTTPEALTLNVTERTEITLNGRPARLADLRPGMRVEARFCRETLNATVIAARTEAECTLVSISGVIAEVDVEGGHLSIMPSTTTTPITLNVTERTEITLNGRAARLSDLRRGMRVEARYCRETSNATVIAARTPTSSEG
jgi:biopolymer transport protein ExbD